MATVKRTEVSMPEIKEFLGGWRNRATGLLYYNASTQTRKSGRNGQYTSDRETQTVLLVDRSTCTRRDARVQVEFLATGNDKIMEGSIRDINPAEVCRDSDGRMDESAVKIQRFYRRYRREKSGNSEKRNVPKTSALIEEPGAYVSGDFTILNRKSPRTRGDFESLYYLLDRWRILESERAAAAFSEPSRVALSSLILSKEVELLRAIDSIKTLARLKRAEKSCRKFLDELSRPIAWRSSAGERILVDTPRVLRARGYRDVFLLLDKYDLPASERLNLLHRAKEIALAHTCKHSRRLLALIEQEFALLTIKPDESRLTRLRDRLKMSFLRLAQDALANDVHADVGWFQAPSKKLCKNCARLLPLDNFPEEAQRISSSCNYCLYLRARKEPRVVYEPYARMLRDVRRAEGRMGCYTSSAFAIRPEIVYHLVNDVWHGKSAISGSDNFDELRLVRLHKDIEWSPWNSLLLTAREARVHRMIDDPEQFYGPALLQNFRTKNLLARVHFQSVLHSTVK